jgi:hypothetical protein
LVGGAGGLLAAFLLRTYAVPEDAWLHDLLTSLFLLRNLVGLLQTAPELGYALGFGVGTFVAWASQAFGNGHRGTADYYIRCVNKDASGGIDSVGTTRTLQSNAPYETKPKSEVIEDLKRDKTVKTVHKRDSPWLEGEDAHQGEDVHHVDGEYIRTDVNNTEADNLGDLPEC